MNEVATRQIRGSETPPGERMCARRDEEDLISDLSHDTGSRRQRVGPDKSEIDLATCKGREHLRAIPWLQRQRDVRVSASIRAEEWRQDGVCGGNGRANADIAPDALGEVSDHARHGFHLAHQGRQPGPQRLAGRRQDRPASKPLEETQTEGLFERTDVPRDGGLGQRHFAAGLGKVPEPRQRQKCSQVAEVEVERTCYMRFLHNQTLI